MPTHGTTKPQTSEPFKHYQLSKHGIVPMAAYDLVLEPYGGL